MFISVLPVECAVALGRDRSPAQRLSLFGSFSQPGEWRQHNEVLDREQQPANKTRDRTRQTQIGLPQPAETRTPDLPLVTLGRDAGELGQGIVHMKNLIAQDVLKNGAGWRIVLQHVAIYSEAAGGGLLR